MKTTIRVIVIDAVNRTVEERTVDNSLKTFQDIVGGYIETAHGLDDGDCVMVNEEGMLASPMTNHWFSYEGGHQPFAGNGFIVGLNYKTGDNIDAKISLEEAKAKIKFHTLDEVREIVTGGDL